MAVINQDNTIGDVVKYMAPSDYSLEYVVVAANQNLNIGSVVGIDVNTGNVVALDPSASDSSSFASGVMLEDVDTTSGNVANATILARHALVVKQKLIFPTGITVDQINVALEQLKSLGIIYRLGA